MKTLAHLIIVAAIGSPTVYAECRPPNMEIQIPSGATATRDDMAAAQKAVKAYDNAVKDFADCLQKIPDGHSSMNVQRQNEEIEKLKHFAAQFNSELKVFKDKNAA